MRLILLSSVEHLGSAGDEVEVKRGYARNFLLPRGLAVPAARSGVRLRVTAERWREERFGQERKMAELRADRIKMLGMISVPSRVGRSGKLFGSVGTRDVVRTLAELGIEVRRGEVDLPEGRIRKSGRHRVEFRFGFGVRFSLPLVVGSEEIRAPDPGDGRTFSRELV